MDKISKGAWVEIEQIVLKPEERAPSLPEDTQKVPYVLHVSGFLVDDETWAIRYLIIDTSNWWIGHKVLVAPPWIKNVHWSDRSVSVDLSRDSIKTAPIYDPALDWSREQELDLYRHYGRSGYWAGSRLLETEI